ncbi:MAG: helix-turn-helix transcriptional regulator [Planctomycetota bacterium]
MTDARFERPPSFQVHRYRRADLYRPGPKDTAVRVRFARDAARFVREISPAEELQERRDGSVERTLRTDSLRWVVDWALQYGDQAEIVGPAPAGREMRDALDRWLDFYQAHAKQLSPPKRRNTEETRTAKGAKSTKRESSGRGRRE